LDHQAKVDDAIVTVRRRFVLTVLHGAKSNEDHYKNNNSFKKYDCLPVLFLIPFLVLIRVKKMRKHRF
jgi:hypothetical protein